MAGELSTLGVKFQYAVEETSGTRPTTGYIDLDGIKSIADFNPEPSNLDVTPLSETEYRRYIPGLKDIGSSLAFTFNHTEEFMTKWAELVEAYETAKADTPAKSVWFSVIVPGLTNAFYFAGAPSPLGLSAIEVDSVLEIEAYISPTKFDGWAAKPTA